MTENITPRHENYSQWYVDIVLQAKLADYSPVKGCMVIRPRGYALWELIQRNLDNMFKETGHVNAYFPLLIPESFLQKEAEHVEGFSPELAVVTHAGGEKLEEPLVVRPTSETIIWSMYKKWIQSYRDLPLLINQWANVLRWEKRTRPFLRTTEFLWQEGHTAHATQEEAEEETIKMLLVYRDFLEEYMAMPVIYGKKSDAEKFAGAISTYAIEAMMQDKKALQAGTSHFLGQNFAKAFDVTFQTKEGNLDYVWASSWGVSTRLIGALIMTHSDDSGLVVPPKLAPTEAVIIPIFKNKNKAEVVGFAEKVYKEMKPHFRVDIDVDDAYSPGWKFTEYEMVGVPIRIEIGPRDMAENKVVLVRRDTGEKESVSVEAASKRVSELLSDIQQSLFKKAVDFKHKHTHFMSTYDQFKDFFISNKKHDDETEEATGGFAEAFWCGSPECEAKAKKDTKATIRVIPFEQNETGSCIFCSAAGGSKSNNHVNSKSNKDQKVVFAKAY